VTSQIIPSTLYDEIIVLEQAILALEQELERASSEVELFESKIVGALYTEILRVRELTVLYKDLKKAKKDKRLEQKKKGKNYKAPIGTNLPISIEEDKIMQLTYSNDRKRLYREALVKVHPDKFAQDEALVSKANELTARLIEVYKNGDMGDLVSLHQHIVTGNAMNYDLSQPESIKDPLALIEYLKKKKTELKYALELVKKSEFYQVLYSYVNPLTYIEELKEQFAFRIQQLEKRTRKAFK
jgi:regulator of replication initiation timing